MNIEMIEYRTKLQKEISNIEEEYIKIKGTSEESYYEGLIAGLKKARDLLVEQTFK